MRSINFDSARFANNKMIKFDKNFAIQLFFKGSSGFFLSYRNDEIIVSENLPEDVKLGARVSIGRKWEEILGSIQSGEEGNELNLEISDKLGYQKIDKDIDIYQVTMLIIMLTQGSVRL